MNKNQIIILLSILFISLAIGLYFVGFQEGLKNAGPDVKVNGYLKTSKGGDVIVNGTNVTIKRLTESGIVAQTEPDIKLDGDGFPKLDGSGKVTYDPQKYLLDENLQMQKGSDGVPIYNPNYGNKGKDVTVGSYLRDDQGNLVSAKGNITIKKLNSKGIVIKTDPDIQLDKFGYALLNSSSKVMYNPQVYLLDNAGQIQLDSNGKPKYNPTYKFTSNPSEKYDVDNVDVTYHPSEKQIISETGSGDLRNNDIYVLKPEIIKTRAADSTAYQNALAELADSQSSTEPDLKKKEDNIKIKRDAVSKASAKLDLDNQIIEQSNKDFLAYQAAISSGDNNAIDKAIATLTANQNYIKIARSNVQGDINYYNPASFRFGTSSTYVPNYEDSVYLSRTTGQSTIGEILNPAYMLGGMCDYYKNQPTQLEAACQKLDKNTCASTSCCVLLGGAKCVSGTEQGPTVKSNFSDIYVRNRDYYYYQGKCYGNCPP